MSRARPGPRPGPLLTDLLAAQVEARAHETAVVDGEDRLSFGELHRAASAVARNLVRAGIRPDDRVGLFVEPSAQALVATWGVLLSGAAYLPLAPDHPDERIRTIIEGAEPRVVLTRPALTGRLVDAAPRGTRTISTADAVRDEPGPPLPAVAEQDLAYVIHTSGSTGVPKGVLIEHRSIAHQLRWLAAAHGLGPGHVVLHKTPASFDAAQWEILAPAVGATVAVGPPGVYRDPVGLLATVARHGVTTLQVVPTLLRALLELDDLRDGASLRQVLSGGEVLSRALAAEFLDRMPGVELVNLYGPTEATINTSSLVVDRAAVDSGPDAVSIGAPAAGTDYRVVAPDGALVAPGEVGELHIGGVQLARGYLDRPALTAQRFVRDADGMRWFRSGDLVTQQPDGTVGFVGRIDNQVKVRGYRIELDEVRLRIEAHDWVRAAAVVVSGAAGTAQQSLVAYLELNPREAALMDQGSHGAHHRSKADRVAVRAQLSAAGLREPAELAGRPVVDLPGTRDSPAARRQAFARKTYRFFEGPAATAADVRAALRHRPAAGAARRPARLTRTELGQVLRYFGQHHSPERLLPKYGYASPGSLYATQLFLEVTDLAGLDAGHYYYHPARHHLVRVAAAATNQGLRLHLVGKRRAIEPVYRTNVDEVLEIEAGHMLGLFDEVLAGYGLAVTPYGRHHGAPAALDAAPDDHYIGAFDVVPHGSAPEQHPVEMHVQTRQDAVADLPGGRYRYADGELRRTGDEIVERRHVIAINQEVYERASLGITLVSGPGPDWLRYVALGRAVARIAANDRDLGFMPAGYSSRSGADLPAARRMADLLGRADPSYFVVGGRISAQQRRNEGMKEDLVHMRGPAEMVRDDLAATLPDYMVPHRVVVLDRLPATVNGKVDAAALRALEPAARPQRPFVAPRTDLEARLAALWGTAMRTGRVSVHDDFFAVGGNSVVAVALVGRINTEFGTALPVQVVFEAPTVAALAARVAAPRTRASSRLIRLGGGAPGGDDRPVFCWPGLGGYPLNLRPLAQRLDRPFYGIQAHGINAGETPYPTIAAAAAADVALIRDRQPVGPYTLWGYSFGARLAYAAAHQLEQAGQQVDAVHLIAPGAPRVAGGPDVAYRTILFSVFAGTTTGPLVQECLRVARDGAGFRAFVEARFPELDPGVIARIVRIVEQTFHPGYRFDELDTFPVTAPVTVLTARGDDYSFLDAPARRAAPVRVVPLDGDHYAILRDPAELAAALRTATPTVTRETAVPHVSIKHHPVPLSKAQESELVKGVTEIVQRIFGCEEGVISIAVEPVEPAAWNDDVYVPEIVNRKDLLVKVPSY